MLLILVLIGLILNSGLKIRTRNSGDEVSDEQARENAKAILMAEYSKVY